MVITCPSCSARYRLNPEKVKGRGAKITCPKCSHIFVVFADGASSPGAEAPRSPAPPSKPAPPRQPPPPPPPEASESGRLTAGAALKGRDKDTTTGAFRAVGLDDKEMASPGTTGKIRVVAPGPRKTRRKVATIDTNNELPSLERPAPTEPAAAEYDDAAEFDGPEPNSASDLDFREVGITTWKVKVAIGLIYDFSDIATLKKYLADKKVTEDDLISHDGKGWVRIGEISDLDHHFIETWKAAKVAQSGDKKGKPAPKPAASESPAGASSTAGYGSGAFPSQTGSYSSQANARDSADSAERAERRARRKAARAGTKERKASKAPLLMLAAVIVLTVVAWFVFANPDQPAVVAGPAPNGDGAASEPDIDDAERARIRREVREQVEAQRAALIAEQAETDRAAEEAESTPVLEAVTPSTARVDASRRGALPAPIRDAPTPTRTPPSAGGSTAGGSQASVAVTATDRKGSMYFDKGKQQYSSGNFGSAKTMLMKAVSKCPECGEYWEYLGKTHQELGEVDDAAAAFAKAQKLGVSVNTARP